MPDPALTLSGITAGYVRDLPILFDVDLIARAGQITTIIGPNGAGKSTLIKAIAGLVPVSGGTVRREQTDITGLRPDRMAAHGIAYVPQTDNIFRSLTIAENLDLALRRAYRDARRSARSFWRSFRRSRPSLTTRPDRSRAGSGNSWRLPMRWRPSRARS